MRVEYGSVEKDGSGDRDVDCDRELASWLPLRQVVSGQPSVPVCPPPPPPAERDGGGAL